MKDIKKGFIYYQTRTTTKYLPIMSLENTLMYDILFDETCEILDIGDIIFYYILGYKIIEYQTNYRKIDELRIFLNTINREYDIDINVMENLFNTSFNFANNYDIKNPIIYKHSKYAAIQYATRYIKERNNIVRMTHELFYPVFNSIYFRIYNH